MLKKSSNISLKNTKDTKLSIQFNLDGFSFCISNIANNNTLYFSEYQFSETQLTPENLLLEVEEIFKKDTNLQHDFSNVTVIHQNNLSTLVPNKYFVEERLADYLNFNIKTLATDFITFDEIDNMEAKNVYVPYVNINNYLFQNFGEFEYKHHISVLLKKLLETTNTVEKTMFVNVSKASLDLVVLQNNKLLFSNSFSFETKEDFIYYILFVAEQLELNTEVFPLYFMGEVKITSDIYKIAFAYIRNIYFLESKNSIFNHLESPKHSNYILLGS
ncbi:DUF3822 family protein [Polaribacter pectinis]|uniref:DUF3822 family protein n=1 Tax=Polaribacter pectinis TaxID=2738844 RepID=A0A7G9LDP9_9FLAO|nr:DUF3822 family protein [Polaribacter pectinis]QNM86748.1 DUF3822 family protein [Polaribacter pectinis]